MEFDTHRKAFAYVYRQTNPGDWVIRPYPFGNKIRWQCINKARFEEISQ